MGSTKPICLFWQRLPKKFCEGTCKACTLQRATLANPCQSTGSSNATGCSRGCHTLHMHYSLYFGLKLSKSLSNQNEGSWNHNHVPQPLACASRQQTPGSMHKPHMANNLAGTNNFPQADICFGFVIAISSGRKLGTELSALCSASFTTMKDEWLL